jgi:hypothetical protein
VHLKLADQQLAALPNGVNSSFIQPVRTLLADAVQALVQNSDIDNNKALVHLKLADQQLAIATSSENNMISPNAALESSKVLMATTPIPSTVSSSTLNHNPLPSTSLYPQDYRHKQK